LVKQQLIKQILKRWKAQFELANNGQEALTLARQKQFDLILMDLQMPKMDGFDAQKAIRKDSANKETPVVALAADALAETKDRVMAAGFQEYLTKPFKSEELWERMLVLLKKRPV
jgi:CheY-like chemotaxis protein